MISFIYFDLGNVILYFDHEIACRNLAALTGKTADQVREVVFASDLEAGIERGEISDAEFYARFCTELDVQPEQAAVEHAASDIFRLNSPMLALIASLHDAGNSLGILSNTCNAHWRFVYGKYRVLRSCFDKYLLSFEVKSAKPDPEIYATAIELADVPAEEIFFTDDKPENVSAAKSAGMNAVLFEDVHQIAAELRSRGVRFNY
jgi:HAD superfamily hydrolase (TIGR01509 family)